MRPTATAPKINPLITAAANLDIPDGIDIWPASVNRADACVPTVNGTKNLRLAAGGL
jgi:hypothetical protein